MQIPGLNPKDSNSAGLGGDQGGICLYSVFQLVLMVLIGHWVAI